MSAFQRLRQRLGIADQYQIPRRTRDGNDVGQRHLAGIVHKENIKCAGEFFTREESGRASDHVNGAVFERLVNTGIFAGVLHNKARRISHGVLHGRREQIADRAVTRTAYANSLSSTQEVDDDDT